MTTAKETCNFTGKVGKSKNKEQDVLHNTFGSDRYETHSSSGNTTDPYHEIKELRNKKLVSVHECGHNQSGGRESDNYSSKIEYIFEQ